MVSLLLPLLLLAPGCASRSYTHYLIEPAPSIPAAMVEAEGTAVHPLSFGSTTAMRVSWNDGTTLTEVEIPLLASGQRIVIAHAPGQTGVSTLPASPLLPPPPTLADATLEEAYRQRGLPVVAEAPAISLTDGRQRMQQALAEGNHALALQWCELVLARYPSHPETLRAKGSILLLLGEREKAISVYEAAEEVESDPAVRRQLESLTAPDAR